MISIHPTPNLRRDVPTDDASRQKSSRKLRATLRELCAMSLPATFLLPPILASLREIVNGDHAAFFFCGAQGDIQNLYAERMLSPEQMALYHDRHFGSRNSDFPSAYLKRVRAKRPVSRHSLSEKELAGSYYLEVLAPLEIHHFLYAIVRNGAKVLGQLSLYRGSDKRAFSAADERALQGLLHYLGPPLDSTMGPGVASAEPVSSEESLAVLDHRDALLYHDRHWPRLLRLAMGGSISPRGAAQDTKRIPEFIQRVTQARDPREASTKELATEWGIFNIRVIELADASGHPAKAVTIRRMVDSPIVAAQVAARTSLTVQQQRVALLMSQGLTNAEIAKRLGVSVHTIGYHAKAIYRKLQIHGRMEVTAVLRQLNL